MPQGVAHFYSSTGVLSWLPSPPATRFFQPPPATQFIAVIFAGAAACGASRRYPLLSSHVAFRAVLSIFCLQVYFSSCKPSDSGWKVEGLRRPRELRDSVSFTSRRSGAQPCGRGSVEGEAPRRCGNSFRGERSSWQGDIKWSAAESA